jgi:hypothetical protein
MLGGPGFDFISEHVSDETIRTHSTTEQSGTGTALADILSAEPDPIVFKPLLRPWRRDIRKAIVMIRRSSAQ